MRYCKAVTGKNDSFRATMKVGQKIWTLERAIKAMTGRTRKTEVFAPFMYKPGASGMTFWGGVPIYENGKWRMGKGLMGPGSYRNRKKAERVN